MGSSVSEERVESGRTRTHTLMFELTTAVAIDESIGRGEWDEFGGGRREDRS